MVNLYIIKRYIRFLFDRSGIRKVHSPFAYEFYKNILQDKRSYYSFRNIHNLRMELLQDNTPIKFTDLGAGSRLHSHRDRSIKDLVKEASKPAKFGRLLFRMVNYYNPKYILELGTSLGLSTAYLASARSQSRVITLEGSPEVLDIAKQNFDRLRLENITTVEGNFDDTLEGVLKNIPTLDMAFIDGNHRKEPTLRYFEQCLSKTHDESVLIFDDIYWTPEMEQAWEAIKAHPSVTSTIDIFQMGIVFFRREIKEKRHFKFKY